MDTTIMGHMTDLHSRITDVLSRISICARGVAQYGRSHPIIDEMLDAAHQALAQLLVIQPNVIVAAGESYLALDNFPIEDGTGTLTVFAEMLHSRKISELKLDSGVTASELLNFAEILSLSAENLTLRGGVVAEMNRRNIVHIHARFGALPTESREAGDPADIYEEALVLIENAMRAVQSGLQIPVPEIRAVVSESLHSLIEDDSTLLALTGIRSYDRYLSEHSVNVCILSMVLSKDLGLDAASTMELGISALLHDIGKVFVDPDIVRKPGRLTEEEWQQIRRHPAEGARALAGLPDLPALASTIALEHHIKSDGSGYPAVSSTHRPHLLSRLVAIVDSYDALTTERPYRNRWSAQEAIAWMLYETSGQYDRQLMARFAARAKLYPLGSLVRLKKGDYAIVVGGSQKHPRQPTIRLITGVETNDEKTVDVDLSKNTDPAFEIDSIAQPVEVLLPYADRLAAA